MPGGGTAPGGGGTASSAPLRPTTIVRGATRAHFTAAFSGLTLANTFLLLPRPIVRQPKFSRGFGGRVWMSRGLAVTASLPSIPVAPRILRPTASVRRPTSGRLWLPAGPPQQAPFKPFTALSVQRPISSPRRLTSGRVSVPDDLPFSASAPKLPTLRGLSVSSPRRLTPGHVSVARQNLPTRPFTLGSIQKPTSSPRRPVAGRASLQRLPHATASAQAVTPFAGLRVFSPRRPVPGHVSQSKLLSPAASAPSIPVLQSVKIARTPNRPRAGHVWLPSIGAVHVNVPGPFTLPANPIVRRRSDDRARSHAGWNLRWSPAPLFGPALPTLGYHIYSNAGSGPINYSASIATVYGLTWTSGPLQFPDTWMFGVRAFDANGEEQNLDAAVTLILDGNGNDITNRPKPPIALRAFPMKAGSIRVEWSYNTINPQPVPTGFYIYLGDNVSALLRPTDQIRGSRYHSAGSVRWRGFAPFVPTAQISRSGITSQSGATRWRPAGHSGINYSTPVAFVSYQSAIAGSFVANIAGLTNGVTYSVAVRAANAVAIEPNLSFVTVTADSVGPSAVVNLTAVATA